MADQMVGELACRLVLAVEFDCGVGLEQRLDDVSEVVIDGASRWLCLHGDIFPQELAVAKGDPA